MPDDIIQSGIGKGCRRVVADIVDAAVFNEHPLFGLQARVTEEEARRTSEEAPLQMAFILSWDGLKVSVHIYVGVTCAGNGWRVPVTGT